MKSVSRSGRRNTRRCCDEKIGVCWRQRCFSGSCDSPVVVANIQRDVADILATVSVDGDDDAGCAAGLCSGDDGWRCTRCLLRALNRSR